MESAAQLLSYPFMRNAFAAVLLASVACGIVGTLVICNRLTFLAGGASHAAYGGIGIAFHFSLPVLPCTVLFTLIASLLMGRIALKRAEDRRPGSSSDAGIGVLWSAGMAFGIILIQLTPGYAGELTAFLFGSLLSVPASDLWIMAGFNLLLLLVLCLCGRGLFLVSADPNFARSRGIPAHALTLLIIGLTAVAVVLLIRVAGLILVLALLTIPPLAARRVCNTFYGAMFGAFVASLAFCLGGLYLSWILNLSPGAVIVGIATVTYFGLSLPLRKFARVFAVCFLILGFFAQPQAVEAATRMTANADKPVGATRPQDKAPAVKPTAQRTSASNKSVESAQRPGQRKPAAATTSRSARSSSVSSRKPAQSNRTTVSSRKPTQSRASSRAGRNRSSDDFDPGYNASMREDLAAKGISSGYAVQRRRHSHKGIDIPAPAGSPALAFMAGEVVFSGRYYAYGNLVRVLQADGKEALYGHLQSTNLQVGDKVKAGDRIGAVGCTGRATGYHLHFELRENDIPMDPAPYFAHACEIVPEAKLCPTPQMEAQAELNASKRGAKSLAQAVDIGIESLAADARKGPYAGNSGGFPNRLRWGGAPNTVLLP